MTDRVQPLHRHFDSVIALKLDAQLQPGALWVTDADGTLWKGDIGEAFLRQLIADGALVSEQTRGRDVWAEYERRVEANKTAGYAWAVQVMEGIEEASLVARAAEFARDFVPRNLLPEMSALLDLAARRGCETWIVSASNSWIVKAAAPLVGIPVERVLGIQVATSGGRLTSELVPPVTHRAGKVEAVNRFIGRNPVLATGDSSGDFELLDSAGGLSILVLRHGTRDEALLKRARQGGWSLHEASVE
jgi:HAD superfamily phosphoserine phosphatase-like hydrolase